MTERPATNTYVNQAYNNIRGNPNDSNYEQKSVTLEERSLQLKALPPSLLLEPQISLKFEKQERCPDPGSSVSLFVFKIICGQDSF